MYCSFRGLASICSALIKIMSLFSYPYDFCTLVYTGYLVFTRTEFHKEAYVICLLSICHPYVDTSPHGRSQGLVSDGFSRKLNNKNEMTLIFM